MCFLSESGKMSEEYKKHGESVNYLTLNKNTYGTKIPTLFIKFLVPKKLKFKKI